MNADVEKAVKRLDSTALSLHKDWNTIIQALRDQEAEIADLKVARDSWADQASDRVKDWDDMRQRAEKAEAQLARARTALASLVARARKVGGYADHGEQGALWEVEALLAEGGK